MKSSKSFRVYFRIICLIIVAGLPIASHAQNDEAAIRQLLDKQTIAWNRGNIEDFMHGYWQSDSLIFIGKNGPKYGYQKALDNYRKSYPDTAAMGKLHFNLLQIKRLSSDYYHVTGKWSLQRTIGDLQGYFTLLFRKIKSNWVIISDHSS